MRISFLREGTSSLRANERRCAKDARFRSLFYSERRRRWTRANVNSQASQADDEGKSDVVADVTFVPVKRRPYAPAAYAYRSQLISGSPCLAGHRVSAFLSLSLSLSLSRDSQ
jgi:hypothetical protein